MTQSYYRIHYVGGSMSILAYSEHDAADQFRKKFPQYRLLKIEKL